MIIGVGIDVVPVERFAESLVRTPGLRDRLFTPAEQLTPGGNPRTGESLAAGSRRRRPLAKALGAPGDLYWHDAEVMVGAHGRPHLEVRGSVAPDAPRSSACPPGTSRSATTAASPRPWWWPRASLGPARFVMALYTAAQVRAAEEPLLASTPRATLMQRAATGLATVCLRLLGNVYGRRVALLVGTGNNGGDALFAGARLAAGAPGDRRPARPRTGPTSRAPAAAATGGRRVAGGITGRGGGASTAPTWCSTGCSASVAGEGFDPTLLSSPGPRPRVPG